jgi:hypothetical protein
LIGSLKLPVFNAEKIKLWLKPQVSNKIIPQLTLAIQCETNPLPLPIRVPTGLDVTAKFVNILTQSLPFFFNFLVIACLAAFS